MNVAVEIAYPALAFVFDGRSVVIVRDQQFFSDATPSQLRGGFYVTPFEVVDSSLGRWSIQEVKTPERGVLTGLADSIRNRPLRIEITGTRDGRVSLETLKAMLSRALTNDPTGIWTGREESPDELVERVDQCRDFREVFAALNWSGA